MTPMIVQMFLWWPTLVTAPGGRTRRRWLRYAWQVWYIEGGQLKKSPWLEDERFANGYLVYVRLRLRRKTRR